MCDGNIVFQGEARRSAKYFGEIGIPCPRFSNPADFYINKLTINYPKQPSDDKKVAYLTDCYFKKLDKSVTLDAKSLTVPPLNFQNNKKGTAKFSV